MERMKSNWKVVKTIPGFVKVYKHKDAELYQGVFREGAIKIIGHSIAEVRHRFEVLAYSVLEQIPKITKD